jgi:SAM-dependent methyltransferase
MSLAQRPHDLLIPLPPDDLMIRIGVSPDTFPDRAARERIYEDVGRWVHRDIRDAIAWREGQSILDFGCGTGRVLRWFASESDVHLTGCDVHRPSIEWMQANFPSNVRLYANDHRPPLPEADETFDLVYCGSVFSHLTDWAPWLLELRRVLKTGGALVASLHGSGFWDEGFHGARGVPWDEDNTGMLVEHYGSKFDDSWGPAVYVSEWWVREHWGRALEIERYEPAGFGLPGNPSAGQAWLVARKPAGHETLAPADLESASADARETTAAVRGRQLAYEEVEHLADFLRASSHAAPQTAPSTIPQGALPYPPLELANRVGSLQDAADPMKFYDELGRRAYEEIVGRLPPDWTFAGKRVLDFGCGAGRTLRHFLSHASEAEIWGCDIDDASINWLSENVSPPFHVFRNGPEPPLEQPDASFDLIWGISVFTHLTDSWSGWLADLHRVLKADGLLYLTFMGRGTSELIAGEPWDENRVGMNVLKYGQSWDLGGPMVMHAPWWIEEHWGRAFEIVSLSPDGFASVPSFAGHGSVTMRKRNVDVDVEMLERIAPGDAREAQALTHNVAQLQAETVELRETCGYLSSKLSEAQTEKQALEARAADLAGRLSVVESSKSWKVTRPLRSIAHQVRVARR